MIPLNMITLNSAVFCMGCAVAYAIWTKVRVLRLRLDIMDKRDQLVQKATSLGILDDPGFQSMKGFLDSLEYSAHCLTVALVLYLVSVNELEDAKGSSIVKSKHPEMQSLIDQISSWASQRVFSYLLRETATGWIIAVPLFPIFQLNPVKQGKADDEVEEGVEKAIGRAMYSNPPYCLPYGTLRTPTKGTTSDRFMLFR